MHIQPKATHGPKEWIKTQATCDKKLLKMVMNNTNFKPQVRHQNEIDEAHRWDSQKNKTQSSSVKMSSTSNRVVPISLNPRSDDSKNQNWKMFVPQRAFKTKIPPKSTASS